MVENVMKFEYKTITRVYAATCIHVYDDDDYVT